MRLDLAVGLVALKERVSIKGRAPHPVAVRVAQKYTLDAVLAALDERLTPAGSYLLPASYEARRRSTDGTIRVPLPPDLPLAQLTSHARGVYTISYEIDNEPMILRAAYSGKSEGGDNGGYTVEKELRRILKALKYSPAQIAAHLAIGCLRGVAGRGYRQHLSPTHVATLNGRVSRTKHLRKQFGIARPYHIFLSKVGTKSDNELERGLTAIGEYLAIRPSQHPQRRMARRPALPCQSSLAHDCGSPSSRAVVPECNWSEGGQQACLSRGLPRWCRHRTLIGRH